MRKVKEIFRLKWENGLTNRQIGKACSLSRQTVADYLARGHGMTWAEISNLTEEALQAKLFAAPVIADVSGKPIPDVQWIHQELRNKHVTLTLLWQEYKETHPDGYQLTQFSDYYRRWKKKLNPVMRQDHKGGEKLFTDYCDGLKIIDPDTGQELSTELFVTVWGASNYTYAEASLSQDLFAWTKSHVHAFEYFECVPQIEVPDNLKSGVSKACRYEPELNPTYHDLAMHYGFAVIPARPYEPRDKAKVEAGVLVAQRWILAKLRHRKFVGLAALNEAIWELLEDLNSRPLRKINRSRRDLFLTWDKPNAKPLPEKPFEYATWKKARVNIDYHLEIENHWYSVPYHLLHEMMDVRITGSVVEIFFKGERVASHARSFQKYQHTTLKEHMPLSHQKHAEWTPERMVSWAAKTGPKMAEFVETLMALRSHPEQGYRAVMGIFRLENDYGSERLEKAAARAIAFKSFSFSTIKNILKRGLEKVAHPAAPMPPPFHENIRGSQYYETLQGGTEHVE